MKRKATPIADVLAVARGTCSNCDHWDANDDASAGYCRRYPPKVVADDEGIATTFPITEPTERCGEHKGRQ